MLWRFFITTSLFVGGDMLSFMSIAHLDVGTFSLVGKALAIILTVLLSRVVLKKGQSSQPQAHSSLFLMNFLGNMAWWWLWPSRPWPFAIQRHLSASDIAPARLMHGKWHPGRAPSSGCRLSRYAG